MSYLNNFNLWYFGSRYMNKAIFSCALIVSLSLPGLGFVSPVVAQTYSTPITAQCIAAGAAAVEAAYPYGAPTFEDRAEWDNANAIRSEAIYQCMTGGESPDLGIPLHPGTRTLPGNRPFDCPGRGCYNGR